MKLTILLIDDEALARNVLRNYLKERDDVEIAGEAANGFDGLKLIQELQPDLVFLDVQMPKLTGFEMLELMDPTQRPMIIFCTAYDEYALKAFEQNAVDYLLKPFSKSRLDEAIRRAEVHVRENNPAHQQAVQQAVDTHRESLGALDRLVVRQGTKIIIIPAGEIEHIQAEDDYVAIHSQGRKYLKQLTMKSLEDSLNPEEFVRIHRSHIVAVRMIDRLEAYTKDSYVAILTSGDKLPVSRGGYQTLREMLGF